MGSYNNIKHITMLSKFPAKLGVVFNEISRVGGNSLI